MAAKEKFFNGPIDKTPYSGCAWVAIFTVAAFLLGFWILFSIAGTVKSVHLPGFKGFSLPKSSGNIVDQVKKAKESPSPSPSATPTPSQSLQDQAEQKIQDEAQKQLQNQLNQAKDQYLP